MTEVERRRVLVTLRNRAAFETAYIPGGAHGAIWVGDVDTHVGARVEVELVFVAELMIFHVRGIVDFRDEERGYRVCIDSRDAKARDAIVRFVQGNADTDVNRRARRFQVQLAVEWADGGDMITGETVDLSSTGTSIHSETLPAKGSIVTIRFLDQNVRFHGDVVWLASDPEPRFGVMFVIGEDEKRAALQGLIGKVLETRAASM